MLTWCQPNRLFECACKIGLAGKARREHNPHARMFFADQSNADGASGPTHGGTGRIAKALPVLVAISIAFDDERKRKQLAVRTLTAISLQVRQSLWGNGISGSLKVIVLTPTKRRR